MDPTPAEPVAPRPTASLPGVRLATLTVVVFLGAVVAWCGGTIGLERWAGAPFLPLGSPRSDPSAVDALWHLATALVLVLPLRDRVAFVLAPVLSLALDVDHVFGSLLPTVLHRPGHALLFAGLVGLLLFRLWGRAPGALAAGAVLAHIGVDGGGFPLLAPFSIAPIVPGFAGELAFVGAAALLFRSARTPLREVVRPRTLAELAAVVAIVGATIYVAWPSILPYTQH